MRALVVYGSWAGSTQSIAEAIGKGLMEKGLDVAVVSAADAKSADAYDVVVAGAAIRAFRPHKKVMRFLNKNASALAGKHVALFAVCMSAGDESEENAAQIKGYLQKMAEAAPGVEPIKTGAFCGVMDMEKLGGMARFIIKRMGGETKDGRDWEAIAAWTSELAEALG